MLYLFNQDDKFINILSKETGLVDMWFKDYQNHLINEPFVFNVKQNSPLIKHIVDENQVAFYDRDNNLRLMRIKGLREVTTSNGGFVNYNIQATCEPSFLELYDHFIEDKRYANKTAQNALDGALQGSRYVGEVTVELGLATDNFYWIDGIGAVFKILETWGGALKDTITLNDKNEIIERKLWIVQRLGADNGLIVEPDFNAEQIERKTLSYVETALWGQGASLETDNGGYTRYITFEDVVWSKSKGDPVDKPKGQKWVGDSQALSQHGYLHNGTRKHRFGHFSNQEYETPEELLWATWNELQERKLKEIVHEAMIHVGDKKVSLGDTVTILDRNYNKPIELQSQITGLEYDPLYPNEDVTIIIGKYIDMNEDPLQKEVDDLKTEVNKPRPTKPITDESFPDIVPGIPINIEAIGGFQAIQLYWDYDSEVYISHYEVYGSQVKDFSPDSQHMLWRGRVSSFVHEVQTDEVWYYRLRTVNTRGTASGYSQQVSASSVRIISDDILFGEILADHLSSNLDIADKLAQNTIDQINKGPMQEIVYTKQEIAATEERLLNQLNSEIGDVNASIGSLNTMADNLKTRADDTDALLLKHGGKFSSMETEINSIEGRLSASIIKVENIDGTVNSHSATLSAQAELINAKLDSLTYQTDKSGIINSIEANKTELGLLATGLELRVTKEEFEALEINGRNLARHSDYFTGWQILAASLGEIPSSSANLAVSFNNAEFNTANSSGVGVTSPHIPVSHGAQYTAQAFIKRIQGDTDSFTLNVLAYDSNKVLLDEQVLELTDSVAGATKTSYVSSYKGLLIYGDNVPNHLWGVFTVTDSKVAFIRIKAGAYRGGAYVSRLSVSDVMLSKGNKISGWVPAPEDTDKEITAVRDRVTTTETDLKVHAGLISAKAERKEVYTIAQTNGLLGDKVDFNVYSNKVGQLDVSINAVTTRVTNAETKVNTLTGDITSAKSQIANLEVKANGIVQSVSEVRKDLDGLEIGGRNLISYTDFSLSNHLVKWYAWNANSTSPIKNTVITLESGETIPFLTVRSINGLKLGNPFGYASSLSDKDEFSLVKGQKYTLSFLVACHGNASDTLNYTYIINADGSTNQRLATTKVTSHPLYGSLTNPFSLNVYEYTITFVASYNTNKGRLLIGSYPSKDLEANSYALFYVARIQLEKGNKATSYNQAPQDTDTRITSAEGSIKTLAGQVELKATQTSVDSVTQRMTKAEGTLNVLPGQIDAKVSKNGVISEINATPEKIKIASKLIHLSGTSQIDDAIIGTAAIANLSVTNAKMALLSVGTAQMQNAAITNAKIANLAVDDAKIANLSVSKLLAGEIDTSKIKIRGGSTTNYTEMVGGTIKTYGVREGQVHETIIERGGIKGTDMGVIRNGVFYGEFGHVTLRAMGKRLDSNASPGDVFLQGDGQVYCTAVQNSDLRIPIQASAFRIKDWTYLERNVWGTYGGGVEDMFVQPSATGALRVMRAYADESSYRPVFASGFRMPNQTFLEKNEWSTYGGGVEDIIVKPSSVGALRVLTAYGSATSYRPVMAGGFQIPGYTFLERNVWQTYGGGVEDMFIRPSAVGSLRVMIAGGTAYRPVLASAFTVNSQKESKQDISVWEESALDKIRNTTVYEYRLKSEVENGINRVRQGLVIGDGFNTPQGLIDGDGVEQYLMNSWNMKAIQELDTKVYGVESRVEKLELENQYLKQKIKQLEERVA